MNLCSSGHEEICYESRQCPVCEIIADKNREIEDKQSTIDRLKEELESAETTIESLGS